MTKILHTADWQVGEQFGQFDTETAAELTRERITVIERLAQLATERAVDAIVVAGDVFELQTVSERSIRRTFAALAGFPGPWVFLPGNHDAALVDSVWTRAQRLGCVPDNAHLCLTPDPLLLHDQRLAILPAPLVQRHTTEDGTRWFSDAQTPEGYARVGLGHGRAGDVLPGDTDANNVIAKDAAATGRLDYLALGDWHGTFKVDDRTWYSGAPETDRFVNNDSGNALIVTVQPGQLPEVTKARTGRFNWNTLQRELRVDGDLEVLAGELDALKSVDVLRLRLSGSISLAQLERLKAMIGKAEATAHAVRHDLDELRLLPSDEDMASLNADGYVAKVFEELQQGQASREHEHAQLSREALEILATELISLRDVAGATR
ncbi:MAG: metallophosphoesterase family protein [Pseudomonas sp.]